MSPEFFPRVWMAVAVLTAVGGGFGALAAWRREREIRKRLRSTAGAPADRARLPAGLRGLRGAGPGAGGGVAARCRAAGLPTTRIRNAALALGALACTAALVGGSMGWVAGAAVAWAAWRRLRSRERSAAAVAQEAEVRAVARQLPLTAELVAACLTAGSGPAQAAEAVGHSVTGPLGGRLLRAASQLRLGGEPGAVWGGFAELPGCEGLARCMERSGTTGVPAVEAAARLAADCRARQARRAAERVRRTSVLVTAPLGLCFLPAFLAVGVAPVVLGLASSLL